MRRPPRAASRPLARRGGVCCPTCVPTWRRPAWQTQRGLRSDRRLTPDGSRADTRPLAHRGSVCCPTRVTTWRRPARLTRRGVSSNRRLTPYVRVRCGRSARPMGAPQGATCRLGQRQCCTAARRCRRGICVRRAAGRGQWPLLLRGGRYCTSCNRVMLLGPPQQGGELAPHARCHWDRCCWGGRGGASSK